MRLLLSVAFVIMFSPIAQADWSEPKSISLKEALLDALVLNPNTNIQKARLTGAKGVTQQQLGIFDVQLFADASHSRDDTPLLQSQKAPPFLLDNITRTDNVRVGFSKLLPFGLTFVNQIDASTNNSTQREVFRLLRENRARLLFQFQMPLLRGRDVSADADAAELQQKAIQHNYQFVASQVIRDVVIAYWNVIGAQKRLAILKRAEKGSEDFYRNLRKLVEAKEAPASDLNLVEADIYNRSGSRIRAEQELLISMYAFASIVGWSEDYAKRISVLTTNLPPIDETWDIHPYGQITQALFEYRDDVLSLESQICSLKRLLKRANLDQSPELTLNLNGGQNYLHEGKDLLSFSHGHTGRFYGAEIAFQFPIPNRSAKGIIKQNQAQIVEAQVSLNDLKRQIFLDARQAFSGLLRAQQQLKLTRLSVDKYKKSLNDELKKLSLGAATVIDVLRVRDDLVGQQLAEVNSHVEYASSIIELAFQTGNTLTHNSQEVEVNFSALSAEGVFDARESKQKP